MAALAEQGASHFTAFTYGRRGRARVATLCRTPSTVRSMISRLLHEDQV